MTAAPLLTEIPRHFVSVADYAVYAQHRLDCNAWSYLHSGAGDEITFYRNQSVFEEHLLYPRPLVKMTTGNTRCELFGNVFETPILVAPIAYQQLFHPLGELATVQATAAMDTGMVVSTLASTSLENVAAVGDSPMWFQLYIQSDREFTLQLVRRAEAAGYHALVITVDAPIAGLRNREQRAGFCLPDGVSAVNLQGMKAVSPPSLHANESPIFQGLMASAPTWDDIAWLRNQTTLPILLKGIAHPDDALTALDMGVDGLVVSNHGGRTMDTVPPSLTLLPAIAACVQGRVPILLDGGIQRGTDIVKAVALGATAVLIGRSAMYGLASAGALGVAHVLKILREELEIAMVLSGCRTLADITPELLFSASYSSKG